MSAANPYLGKWQILYTPSGGGAQQVFSWQSSWQGHPNIAAFAVYQGATGNGSTTPVYFILPDFQNPSDWNSWMTPWLTFESGLDTFGITLFFNDKEDSPTPAYLNAVLVNPPQLPTSANPSPNQYAPGPVSVYDLYGNGQYYQFGWAQFGGQSGFVPVQVPTALQLVWPGASYLRNFFNSVAPANTDFTYIDISGEDYSSLTLTGCNFTSSLCTGTNFSSAVLNDAQFGGYGAITQANFSNATLQGATFQGLDFTGVDFSGADLTGAQFSGCTMHGTLFHAAQLGGSTFTDCDLTGAIFSDLPLTTSTLSFPGSILDSASFAPSSATSDLSGASFVGVKSMVSCSFQNTLLNGTNFDQVPLAQVDFTGANLTGTLLTHTDLRTALFSSPPGFSTDSTQLTNLSGSTLNYALIGATWSYLNLSDAVIEGLPSAIPNLVAWYSVLKDQQLTGMDLQGADFTGADLRQCDLAACNLSSAIFAGAQLQGDETLRAAVLSNAQLENANLSGANLTGTQFSGAYLWGEQVTLAEAVVIRTNFTGAYLAGVKFMDVAQKACQGAMFGRACLVNVSFNGTDCGPYQGQPASFVSACLQGTDFTDASLDGADLSGAAVAAAPVTVDATIQVGWPVQPLTLPLSALATLGVQAATDGISVCPNGQQGPCTPAQQQVPGAPTAWPVTTSEGSLVAPP